MYNNKTHSRGDLLEDAHLLTAACEQPFPHTPLVETLNPPSALQGDCGFDKAKAKKLEAPAAVRTPTASSP